MANKRLEFCLPWWKVPWTLPRTPRKGKTMTHFYICVWDPDRFGDPWCFLASLIYVQIQSSCDGYCEPLINNAMQACSILCIP